MFRRFTQLSDGSDWVIFAPPHPIDPARSHDLPMHEKVHHCSYSRDGFDAAPLSYGVGVNVSRQDRVRRNKLEQAQPTSPLRLPAK
jgi:hypothetical protein